MLAGGGGQASTSGQAQRPAALLILNFTETSRCLPKQEQGCMNARQVCLPGHPLHSSHEGFLSHRNSDLGDRVREKTPGHLRTYPPRSKDIGGGLFSSNL